MNHFALAIDAAVILAYFVIIVGLLRRGCFELES
jgi:hypothetical protein